LLSVGGRGDTVVSELSNNWLATAKLRVQWVPLKGTKAGKLFQLPRKVENTKTTALP
jgi:hypothetical protein